MSRAYDAAAWQSFFQAVVAAAAALLGLLFVAASLRIAVVTDSAPHRARAREALGQLLALVILGVLVLIPGQDRQVLGAEVLAYGIVVAVITVRLQSNTVRRLPAGLRARWVARDMTYNLAVAAVPIAGLGLVLHRLGGLYWLAPATVVFFVWSSLQAWSLLVEPKHDGAR
jgi:modulator of FtsH protease